jgi:hypothetical protein
LKDPTKGVYTKESITPLIEFDKPYSARDRENKLIQVVLSESSIIIDKGLVTDKFGHFITELKTRPDIKLFMEPQLPTRGINIVREYIESDILRNSKWTNHKKCFSGSLEKYFKEEFLYPVTCVEQHVESFYLVQEFSTLPNPVFLQCEEMIHSTMRETRAIIGEYVKDDEWGIYDIGHRNTDISVTRTGDFRVQDWMSKFGHHYK